MNEHRTVTADITAAPVQEAPLLLPRLPEKYAHLFGTKLLSELIHDLTIIFGEHGHHLTPAQLVDVVHLAKVVARLWHSCDE